MTTRDLPAGAGQRKAEAGRWEPASAFFRFIMNSQRY